MERLLKAMTLGFANRERVLPEKDNAEAQGRVYRMARKHILFAGVECKNTVVEPDTELTDSQKGVDNADRPFLERYFRKESIFPNERTD